VFVLLLMKKGQRSVMPTSGYALEDIAHGAHFNWAHFNWAWGSGRQRKKPGF
jgi:hypothetical protein